LSVQSDTDTTARISIFAGGELITSQDTALRQGENNRTLTLESTDAGFRDFSVIVEPQGDDGFYQNNRLATFSQIVGPSRVLLVGADDETRYLRDALLQAGLLVDTASADGIPGTPAGLAQYSSVVLANVPAVDLPTGRMLTLQTYVRDLGGGLLVMGGPDAYGPGGYFRTPLEEILPVEMQLKDQQRLPQLTLAYVIDRSGSMAATDVNGVPLIEVAKSAINRSVDLLQPTDRAAIATFDAVAYWIADFQEVRDRRPLQELVGTLRPSGGTDVLSGMRLVADTIINEPARLKHIILLTDGQTNPTGLVSTAEALFRDHNVTTTTIAIGGASSLLESMARAGGGNYRIADDITQVPLIFAQETVLVTRSYILETPFVPTLTAVRTESARCRSSRATSARRPRRPRRSSCARRSPSAIQYCPHGSTA
jgi:Mg-chelatase subunit ChlD